MRTKSARIARKRGGQNRRDDTEVERYPNGRIDYTSTNKREDVMAVAKAQRIKLPGVVAGNANSATAGTILGRMLLQSEISEAQYRAGKEFEKRRAAYLQAIQAPKTGRSGSDFGHIRDPQEPEHSAETVFRSYDVDGSTESYVERCNRARSRYSDVRSAAMNADPLGMMAMVTIVCEDQMVPLLVGPMRVACNAIARELQFVK